MRPHAHTDTSTAPTRPATAPEHAPRIVGRFSTIHSATLHAAGDATRRRLDAYRDLVLRLARLSSVEAVDGPVVKGAAQIVLDETTVALPLAGVIDMGGPRRP